MEPVQNRFLEELFRSHCKNLLVYANTCLGNSSVAEDVVQDTFHEAANQISKLMQHPYPDRWLIKTLKFKIQNYTRAQRRQMKYLVDCIDLTAYASGDSVETSVINGEQLSLFQRIRNTIREDELSFLIDATLNKYSHDQLAAKYGITVWASAKRLSRIREKLFREFPEHRKRKKH